MWLLMLPPDSLHHDASDDIYNLDSNDPPSSSYCSVIHGTTWSILASSSLPVNIDTAQPSGRKYPAIVHATIITAFLLPIVALPYLAARRQIVPLHRKLEILEKDVHSIRNGLAIAVSNQRSTTSELHNLQTAVNVTLKKSNELRNRANFRAEAKRAALNRSLSDLHGLLNGARQSSDAQTTTLHALGMSLAEVAAFMQEIERNLGLETSGSSQDQRGIERLRLLALRMQSLPHTSNQNI
ncbi:hypothetical protein HYPSUDRAFT_38585 [Hypholoma sublateritium FD-334 SS-4]|uniref:Uncharacterized protein n=1 Tax=Hypholoma sublateritium (strain FD-334 SS-4) TaxID=945553 RepID=A0A0D2LBC1_HYPSF|nr:hypothetical protein HYPSUDRAFT_38585 [Hypholoma sublateritium FD-334 SS-4]